jgi:hypothetical protein
MHTPTGAAILLHSPTSPFHFLLLYTSFVLCLRLVIRKFDFLITDFLVMKV